VYLLFDQNAKELHGVKLWHDRYFAALKQNKSSISKYYNSKVCTTVLGGRLSCAAVQGCRGVKGPKWRYREKSAQKKDLHSIYVEKGQHGNQRAVRVGELLQGSKVEEQQEGVNKLSEGNLKTMSFYGA
jgi:hypothetical protein